MRLGKRERLARKLEQHAKLAIMARIVSVGPAEGKYVSSWDRMHPHGKPTLNWEYRGRNATRIARRKVVTLGVRNAD